MSEHWAQDDSADCEMMGDATDTERKVADVALGISEKTTDLPGKDSGKEYLGEAVILKGPQLGTPVSPVRYIEKFTFSEHESPGKEGALKQVGRGSERKVDLSQGNVKCFEEQKHKETPGEQERQVEKDVEERTQDDKAVTADTQLVRNEEEAQEITTGREKKATEWNENRDKVNHHQSCGEQKNHNIVPGDEQKDVDARHHKETGGEGQAHKQTSSQEMEFNKVTGEEVRLVETLREQQHKPKETHEEPENPKETALDMGKQSVREVPQIKKTAKVEVKMNENIGEQYKQKETVGDHEKHKEKAGEEVKHKERLGEERENEKQRKEETLQEELQFKETTGEQQKENEARVAELEGKYVLVGEETHNKTLSKEKQYKMEVKEEKHKDTVGTGMEEIHLKETNGNDEKHNETTEKQKQNETDGRQEINKKASVEGVKHKETTEEVVKYKELPGELHQQKEYEDKHQKHNEMEVIHKETAVTEEKDKGIVRKEEVEKDLAGGIEMKQIAQIQVKISGRQEKCANIPGGQEKEKETADNDKPTHTDQPQVKGPKETFQEHQECIGTVGIQKQHKGAEQQEINIANQETLFVPLEYKEPETTQGWLELCAREWELREKHIIFPENPDWKDIYKKRPFGRNFLRSPNPEGLSTSMLPPQEQDPPLQRQPLETLGDFSGWKISTEEIPVDESRVPPGVVVCYLPVYSWCVKEQLVDLLAEGLWAQLLDSFQPHIYILDWYEDSKLHKQVYELHVKLLAEDKKTIIAQVDLTPENDMSGEPTRWNTVSHIFKSYGPGVRFIHFLHKSKDLSVLGFHRTRVADSTLFIQLQD